MVGEKINEYLPSVRSTFRTSQEPSTPLSQQANRRRGWGADGWRWIFGALGATVLAVTIKVSGNEEGEGPIKTNYLRSLDNQAPAEAIVSERDKDELYDLAVRVDKDEYRDVAKGAEKVIGVNIDPEEDHDLDLAVYKEDYVGVFKQKGYGSDEFEVEPEKYNKREIEQIKAENGFKRLP